jgi:hypothetical protein
MNSYNLVFGQVERKVHQCDFNEYYFDRDNFDGLFK